MEPGGFFYLAAGQTARKRPEALGSPRMEMLLRAARATFDLVVVDCVPILPVADTVLMQDLVDGFLFVVRSRQTPRSAVRDALAKLRSDRILGVALNDHREYRGSYKDRAYGGYGLAYGSPRSAEASYKLGMGPQARG